MIGVVATISVVNGKEQEFEEIAIKLVNAVNTEEDENLFYRLYKKSSHTYVFMEGYRNRDALKTHTATNHYKKYGKAMAEFLDGSPEVVIMDELSTNK
jgi:quinol monooxygenase YgiN